MLQQMSFSMFVLLDDSKVADGREGWRGKGFSHLL